MSSNNFLYTLFGVLDCKSQVVRPPLFSGSTVMLIFVKNKTKRLKKTLSMASHRFSRVRVRSPVSRGGGTSWVQITSMCHTGKVL